MRGDSKYYLKEKALQSLQRFSNATRRLSYKDCILIVQKCQENLWDFPKIL